MLSLGRRPINIKTGYGAVGGSADDRTPFSNFNTFARAQTSQVAVELPFDSYVVGTGGNTFNWFAGVQDLFVYGRGSTVNYLTGGGGGVEFDLTHSARIATVSAGAISVTLLDISKASLFAAGAWGLVSWIDTQGSGGPPNPGIFEFVQFAKISGAVVTLTGPLRHGYKSTGPGFHYPSIDEGGPATLYALSAEWPGTLIVNNLISDQTDGVYGAKQYTTWNDVTFLNQKPAPSVGANLTYNRCHFAATGQAELEVDKIVTTLTFNQCTSAVPITVQSGSVENLIFNGGSLFAISGTSRNTIIRGGTLSNGLAIGPQAFGITDTLLIEDDSNGHAVIASVDSSLGARFNVSDFTNLGGGQLSISKATFGPIAWAIPGARVMYVTSDGTGSYGLAFTVQDVAEDGTNTILLTDAPSSFPAYTSGFNLSSHPCWDVTVTGAIGCPAIIDLATGTPHRPLFEHVLRTYDGSVVSPSRGTIKGALVFLTVNVTKAYSGVQSSLLATISGVVFRTDTHVTSGWSSDIDLKATGLRTISPSGNSGSHGADSLASGASRWIITGIDVVISAVISGESAALWPSFVIECSTSQG